MVCPAVVFVAIRFKTPCSFLDAGSTFCRLQNESKQKLHTSLKSEKCLNENLFFSLTECSFLYYPACIHSLQFHQPITSGTVYLLYLQPENVQRRNEMEKAKGV